MMFRSLLSTRPRLSRPALLSIVWLVVASAPALADDYNTHTQIAMRNNFPGPVTITLDHHYSDDRPTSQTWENVQPGATTGGWVVGYNTGIGRTGRDYWNVTVVTESGSRFQNTTRDKECYMTKADKDTTLVFGVSESRFDLNMRSSGCHDDMGFLGYNTHTRIAVKNHFYKPVRITLQHRYSDDRPYSQTWENVQPGATTPGWDVGYNTGFGRTGHDYWNITVFDGTSTWENTTRGKECYLTAKDANTTLTFDVSNTVFDLNMNSSSCQDYVAMVATSKPRPVWVVAHMCNAPEYVADAMANGANGVECDIDCKVGSGGKFEFEVHHGYAGPGYPDAKANARTALVPYLEAVRAESLKHPSYVLQYFDCKIPDGLSDATLAALGAELAKTVREVLYNPSTPAPLYSLFNCADIGKVAFLSFAHDQGTGPAAGHLGVTVDQTGTPNEVLAAFNRLGITRMGWFTHGTNIILPNLFESMMRQAVEMREAGQFNRVCEWTVNKTDSIDTLMTIGIDGILCDTEYSGSNGVKNFLNYIRGNKLLRLATPADNPFLPAN